MVRLTVYQLGEHIIDDMTVSGPFANIILQMAEVFLAGYDGPPEERDLHFAQYIIDMGMGQGKILEYSPTPPQTHH